MGRKCFGGGGGGGDKKKTMGLTLFIFAGGWAMDALVLGTPPPLPWYAVDNLIVY